jgi:hypothetical protein
VAEVFWGTNGQLIVVAETDPKPGGRDQPTFGWGCRGLFGLDTRSQDTGG